jgi:ribosomal protein L35AE/L33A
MRSWRHSTTVEGARVSFPKKRVLPARRLTLAMVANADEDASVDASLYRGKRRVLRQRSSVKAYRSRIVRFSTRFRPGRYTFRVTLRAALNPARSKSFSAPLRITR